MMCYECKQVFVRGTGEFTRHLRETSCRPYACDICDKLFKKKSNMKTHRLTHSEDTAVCAECGASFKCASYLKNHQKRVHHMTFTKDDDTSSSTASTSNDTDQPQPEEHQAKRMKMSPASSSSTSPSLGGTGEIPTSSSISSWLGGNDETPGSSFDEVLGKLMARTMGK